MLDLTGRASLYPVDVDSGPKQLLARRYELDSTQAIVDNYPDLEILDISGSCILNFTSLMLLENLYQLTINEVGLEAFSQLPILTGLLYLHADGNRLSSTCGCEKFENLQLLSLQRNRITQLSRLPSLVLNIDLRLNPCEFDAAAQVFTEAIFVNGKQRQGCDVDGAVEYYFQGKIQTFCVVERSNGKVVPECSDYELYEFMLGSFPLECTENPTAEAYIVVKKDMMLQLVMPAVQTNDTLFSSGEPEFDVLDTFYICSLDVYEACLRDGSYAQLVFDMQNCEIESIQCTWVLDDTEIGKNCQIVKISFAYDQEDAALADAPLLHCNIVYYGRSKEISQPVYRRGYRSVFPSQYPVEQAKALEIIKFSGYPIVGDYIEIVTSTDSYDAFQIGQCRVFQSVDDVSEVQYNLETPVSWVRLVNILRTTSTFKVYGDVLQVMAFDDATKQRIRIRAVYISESAKVLFKKPFKLIFAQVNEAILSVLPCPTAVRRQIKMVPHIKINAKQLEILPYNEFDGFYSCKAVLALKNETVEIEIPDDQPYSTHQVDLAQLCRFSNQYICGQASIQYVYTYTNLISKEQFKIASEKLFFEAEGNLSCTSKQESDEMEFKSRLRYFSTNEILVNEFDIQEQLQNAASALYVQSSAVVNCSDKLVALSSKRRALLYQYALSTAQLYERDQTREDFIPTGKTLVGEKIFFNVQRQYPNFYFGILSDKPRPDHSFDALLQYYIIVYLEKKHQSVSFAKFALLSLNEYFCELEERDLNAHLIYFRIDDIVNNQAESDLIVVYNKVQAAGQLIELYTNYLYLQACTTLQIEAQATCALSPAQFELYLSYDNCQTVKRGLQGGAIDSVLEVMLLEHDIGKTAVLNCTIGPLIYYFAFGKVVALKELPSDLCLLERDKAMLVPENSDGMSETIQTSLAYTLKLTAVSEIPTMIASYRLQNEQLSNQQKLLYKYNYNYPQLYSNTYTLDSEVYRTAKIGTINYFKPKPHEAANVCMEETTVYLDFKVPQQLLSCSGITLFRVYKHLYFEEIKNFFVYCYDLTACTIEYTLTQYDANFQIFAYVKDSETKLLRIYQLTDLVMSSANTNRLLLQAVNLRFLTLSSLVFAQNQQQYVIKKAIFEFVGDSFTLQQAQNKRIVMCSRRAVRAIFHAKQRKITIASSRFSISLDIAQNDANSCYQLFYLMNALVCYKPRQLHKYAPYLRFSCNDFSTRIEPFTPCVFARIGRNGFVSLQQQYEMGFALSDDDLGFRVGAVIDGQNMVIIHQYDVFSKAAVLIKSIIAEFKALYFNSLPATSAGEVVQAKFTRSEFVIFNENSVIFSCEKGRLQVVVLGNNSVIVSDGVLKVKLHFASVAELQKFYFLGDVTFLGEE